MRLLIVSYTRVLRIIGLLVMLTSQSIVAHADGFYIRLSGVELHTVVVLSCLMLCIASTHIARIILTPNPDKKPNGE